LSVLAGSIQGLLARSSEPTVALKAGILEALLAGEVSGLFLEENDGELWNSVFEMFKEDAAFDVRVLAAKVRTATNEEQRMKYIYRTVWEEE
jgi:hypothetical protein